MEYDYKILEEKFKNLPVEVQEALSSVKITNGVRAIGKKHGLMIDQDSSLFDLVSLVLLGLVASNDFVKILAKETGIDDAVANNIAVDINKEIFDSIKASMQANQQAEKNMPANQQLNSSLERAGNFEIEPEDAAPTEDPNPTTDLANDARETLSSIEDPQPAPARSYPNTEPLVDQLLNTPTGLVEERTEKKSATASQYGMPEPKPQPPDDLPTSDPYREPTK